MTTTANQLQQLKALYNSAEDGLSDTTYTRIYAQILQQETQKRARERHEEVQASCEI